MQAFPANVMISSKACTHAGIMTTMYYQLMECAIVLLRQHKQSAPELLAFTSMQCDLAHHELESVNIIIIIIINVTCMCVGHLHVLVCSKVVAD